MKRLMCVLLFMSVLCGCAGNEDKDLALVTPASEKNVVEVNEAELAEKNAQAEEEIAAVKDNMAAMTAELNEVNVQAEAMEEKVAEIGKNLKEYK